METSVKEHQDACEGGMDVGEVSDCRAFLGVTLPLICKETVVLSQARANKELLLKEERTP